MELRHLRTFERVLAAGSFLGAARTLACSQSTVTLHVQELEASLGAPLFVRAGRRVELTAAGRLVAARLPGILDSLGELRRSIDELARGDAGALALGAIEPAASQRIAPLLAGFCATRPGARVRLEVGGSEGVARGVAAGELDLGVASPAAPSRRLLFDPLYREPMALLVPRRHPLARAPRVRARDLRGVPLLLSEQGCAYRAATERALADRGVSALPAVELGSIAALQQAVRAGLGVALVPAAAPGPPAGTRLVRLADVDLALPVGILRRSDAAPPPPLVASFVSALRQRCAEGSR
jgi:DNA-binding transcriptional LysR family regulator